MLRCPIEIALELGEPSFESGATLHESRLDRRGRGGETFRVANATALEMRADKPHDRTRDGGGSGRNLGDDSDTIHVVGHALSSRWLMVRSARQGTGTGVCGRNAHGAATSSWLPAKRVVVVLLRSSVQL